VDGDRFDPHLFAGPNDPVRDLAAIGYQNFANFSHLKIVNRVPQTGRLFRADDL